jgi:hypothetical protein
MIGPAPSPPAMIKRATHADDWFAGSARRAIAGLAFGVGHRGFTDGFAWHDFHSEALDGTASPSGVRSHDRE